MGIEKLYEAEEKLKEFKKIWNGEGSTLILNSSLEDVLRSSNDISEIEKIMQIIFESVFYGEFSPMGATLYSFNYEKTFTFIMNRKKYRCSYSGYSDNEQRYGLKSPEGKEFPIFNKYTCYLPNPKKVGNPRTLLSYEYKSEKDNFKKAILDAFEIEFSKMVRRE